MTNQSKWLISAYAIFHGGGVLVPLDYKLDRRRASAIAGALQSKVSGHRILFVARHYAVAGVSTTTKCKPCWSPKLRQARILAAHFGGKTFAARATPCLCRGSGKTRPALFILPEPAAGPRDACSPMTIIWNKCKALIAWYPFWPGVRYLSILPTNHAIDFMVGFIGPFVCGACVVHLRTLRPEFVRDAFVRYKITYVSLVPMVLKNLERGLKAKFDELSQVKAISSGSTRLALNKFFTGGVPIVRLSRVLLRQVHKAFGGDLRLMVTGGAFMEPSTLQFFYDLGIPVANGYGLTEAGTALTLNDLKPFRADTVGKPLPGVDLRVLNPDSGWHWRNCRAEARP